MINFDELTNKISGETNKQIVRRILRYYAAQDKIDREGNGTIEEKDKHNQYEAMAEHCREEIFIRLYNKGLIDDWTDYEGLPCDAGEAINAYFADVKHEALWVLGDGGWC